MGRFNTEDEMSYVADEIQRALEEAKKTGEFL